ncbi:hypothetical protein [Alterisphingorhabdus coralli]|uniref:Uncharacterized protein n=1 Tax=Alterisphingorhabdus coralli TaxID=3071408 RepID=A0AA97FAH8_9SPHN|nr:hypothetical protein [Parasphingorhabdus sp. SCSIO 66989]WOE76581.1 hypothetical protein RB602_07675 [Parasphingorhabdus sp. SCSIO 66989]
MGFEYRIESDYPDKAWIGLAHYLMPASNIGDSSEGPIYITHDDDMASNQVDIQIDKTAKGIWITFISTREKSRNLLSEALTHCYSQNLVHRIVDDDDADRTHDFVRFIDKDREQ